MIRTLLLTFLLGSSVTLAACNTVEGAGRDLQSAGSAVEDSAK